MAIRVEDIKEDASVQQSIEILLGEYRLHLEAADRSPKTISGYMDILHGFFFNFLLLHGIAKQISEIGHTEVDLYLKHLRESKRWPNRKLHNEDTGRLSPYTIQGKVRGLKAFWSWLFKSGHMENNPLAGYGLPGVLKKLIPILKIEHIRKLLRAIDRYTSVGCRDYCSLLMLYDFGPRVSELVRIKMIDLSLVKRTVRLFGKGRKERVVPFHSVTRKELMKYIERYRSNLCAMESEYLFPAKDGGHISVNGVQQMIRRLVKKQGFRTLNVLHTFSGTLVQLE